MGLGKGLLKVGNYLARIGDRLENKKTLNDRSTNEAYTGVSEEGKDSINYPTTSFVRDNNSLTELRSTNEAHTGASEEENNPINIYETKSDVSEERSNPINIYKTKYVRAVLLVHYNSKGGIIGGNTSVDKKYISVLSEVFSKYMQAHPTLNRAIERISETQFVIINNDDYVTGLPSDMSGRHAPIKFGILIEGETSEEAIKVASATAWHMGALAYASTAFVNIHGNGGDYNGLNIERIDDIVSKISEHEEYGSINMKIGEAIKERLAITNVDYYEEFNMLDNFPVGPDGKPVHEKDEWKYAIIPDWQKSIQKAWQVFLENHLPSMSTIKKLFKEERGNPPFLEHPTYEDQNS